MGIRNATIHDIDTIYALGNTETNFRVDNNQELFWSTSVLRNWVVNPDDITLVYEHEEGIVAFLLASHHKPTRKLVIENIFVAKHMRQKNIASDLLNMCTIDATANGIMYIVAETNNTHVIPLFEKHNFSKGFTFDWLMKRL